MAAPFASRTAADESNAATTLTAREIEVLLLVARGLRNKGIAADVRISEETAQGHVKSILSKLPVHDRTEAVDVGIGRGFVHVE